MSKPIIVSGIQPTGDLHIGNYLGAVKNWVDLQESGKYQMYIFIADLHSLTGDMDAKQRHEQIVVTAAELLAAGIDPMKTVFFVQSHVSEHVELCWALDCVTPIAELERMTQYKDKSRQQERNVNAGLFTYPVLQAADILLYHGDFVPVGQDQVQHVELTRAIGRAFNRRYGEYFSEVKHLLTDTPKVMSLLEPDKKMSKSLGEGHIIELGDEPAVIDRKFKKAVTATAGGGSAPGVLNLLLLLKKFGAKSAYQDFVKAEKAGTVRYSDLKTSVSKAIAGYFAPYRAKRKKLLADHDRLAQILIAGAEKAGLVAGKTMERVREIVGLR